MHTAHPRHGQGPRASTPHRPRPGCHGFTLIELMICTCVLGMLTTVALPTLENQLHKSRRSDVLVSVMQIQAAQERFRGNGASYGTLAEIGVPGVSAAGHYALQIASVGVDRYDVLAAAIGAQARDTGCRHMKVQMIGANAAYASGSDASVANSAAANRACWML